MVAAATGAPIPELTAEAAASWVAALCGIEAEHVGPKSPARDLARHGPHALAQRCRIVALDSGEPVEGLPRFTRDDIRPWRGAPWAEALGAFQTACLEGRERALISPLHRAPARVIGELVLDAHQILVAMQDGALCFFLLAGRIPQGVYYPARDLFLVLNPYPLNHRASVWRVLNFLLPRPLPFARWLARALRGALRPAFVVGDMRPGHFLKESLAYLDAREEALLGFLDRGGLLALITDWCAMDPLALLPSLRRGDVLLLRSVRAAERCLDLGLDAHRVFRTKSHPDAGWLRRRLGVVAHQPDPARFRLLLSVDAERGRVLNQVEAFRFVLRRLRAACRARGMALDVVWDGWTVPNLPGERDLAVMAKIEAAIAAITAAPDAAPDSETRIFGRSFAAKVPDIATCDLAIATQGTAALLPSWLLERPTIVYHAASQVPNRSDLAAHSVFQLDQRAVIEETPDAAAAHGLRFSLALWGLDDALVRAVGERLGLRREIPDQTTMKAGTA